MYSDEEEKHITSSESNIDWNEKERELETNIMTLITDLKYADLRFDYLGISDLTTKPEHSSRRITDTEIPYSLAISIYNEIKSFKKYYRKQILRDYDFKPELRFLYRNYGYLTVKSIYYRICCNINKHFTY